ncbi:glycosyltransferase family 2 protein [Flavimarina sp. Hel_I_48]|uniref:glycosyltransferase family 2 protein n=1 Tax=Flavimarina sp. Hel_I_48 TaxID=1392488 RepID=UPI0004DFA51E|nr:glycosyltransferase family 2 protein [Flavimarina sp. Hel_I_48]
MNNLNQIYFSIGIPAYKGEYLQECIESILSQNYKNFELIIINDCSPDPIDTIVREFNDPRINYFLNEQNIGGKDLVLNWNKCLSKASGNYFILMGDDDKMEPDYLQEFKKLILKYPDLAIYHCRSIIIDENSKPIMLTPSCPEFETVYENIWHRRFGDRIQFISDFVYKTSTLKAMGGFYNLPMAWASDDISAFRAMQEKGIAHTNKPLLNYRKHPKTLSNSGNILLKMNAIMLQIKWFKSFLADTPTCPLDQITHSYICRHLPKNFQKQKLMTIKESMNNGLLKRMFLWFRKRKIYKITTQEIIYAMLLNVKTAFVNKKY